MSQWIHEWSHKLIAVAGGIFVFAALALAGAAPVLAKALHGGAHGRASTLVQSGHIAPLATTDLIAVGVAAAVACIAVAVERRLTARKASRVNLRPVRSDQATSRRRAA